ncbi:hypothetical protein D3C78_1816850 [compost metagenome]
MAAAELFQVALNRAFRTGVTQLNSHQVDARMQPTSEQGVTRRVHQGFVDTATGHVRSSCGIPGCYAVWRMRFDLPGLRS